MSASSAVTSPRLVPSSPADESRELSRDRLWWCRLPRPLSSGVLSPGAEDWPWRPVRLIDAYADRFIVVLEIPGPDESAAPLILTGEAARLLAASPC
ncbi:hypothetical protein [Naasia sp. SYSU D00948]|uniref:hypothetical protein n=1 Tax=Naasia sp. SYSU D00948 TaxID=2817379 RepID=UPI001B30E297|nr:hypothetical protein [Naasia sp. SYSU D00948]